MFIKPALKAAQESCHMIASLKKECARAIDKAITPKIEEAEYVYYSIERDRIKDERDKEGQLASFVEERFGHLLSASYGD